MKKIFTRLFYLALMVLTVVTAYNLYQRGVVEAVGQEVARYGDINVNYIYILVLMIVGSFPAGWLLSRFKIRD